MRLIIKGKKVSFSDVPLKRKPGMRVLGSQLFRRLRVPPNKVKNLQREFKRRLSDPDYFWSLPKFCISQRVRLDSFQGVPVVVKYTSGMDHHGAFSPKEGLFVSPEQEVFHNNILAHQRAVRNKLIKPKRYLLRSHKLYYANEEYLVFEFVSARTRFEIEDLTQRHDFDSAVGEMAANFVVLRIHNKINLSNEGITFRNNAQL